MPHFYKSRLTELADKIIDGTISKEEESEFKELYSQQRHSESTT